MQDTIFDRHFSVYGSQARMRSSRCLRLRQSGIRTRTNEKGRAVMRINEMDEFVGDDIVNPGGGRANEVGIE